MNMPHERVAAKQWFNENIMAQPAANISVTLSSKELYLMRQQYFVLGVEHGLNKSEEKPK